MSANTVLSLDGKNPMSPGLSKVLRNYRSFKSETGLKPVQEADKRGRILKDFLACLAEEFGRVLAPTHIDANGEMNFNLDTRNGPAQYGEELADIISRVPRRMGVEPTEAPMMAENNWCRINHFDVERLLKSVQDDVKYIPNPALTASPAPEPSL